MTKADRQELDKRLRELEYYRGLALIRTNYLDSTVLHKILAKLRLEETVEDI